MGRGAYGEHSSTRVGPDGRDQPQRQAYRRALWGSVRFGVSGLRGGVLARNGGDCSFCGLSAAVETHHSGLVYPCGARGSCCGRRRVGVGDLVGLCSVCHLVATTLRRFVGAGGSVFEFSARFMEVIAQCGTGSGFRDYPGHLR